jgi:hypothetical protein
LLGIIALIGLLGGKEKVEETARSGEDRGGARSVKQGKGKGQAAQVPKSLNPFTRALAPPFIGRRREFYITTTPLASENIPSVNAYRIVFFI